jgi:glycosyltransferase involved in cell wall biosynthesis
VIVTARDEQERIGATLRALSGAFPAARILVADDGSRDRTAAIARDHGATVIGAGCGHPRGARRGKGAAATRAAAAALADLGAGAGHEVVLFCDADLGASAGRLGALVQAVAGGEGEVAVAAFSRRVGGGVGAAVGFARWALRRDTGLRLRAPISGQRALRADALAAVLPFAPGFGMELGMTIDAVRAGYRVVEIELDLDHRAGGRTPRGFLHRGRQGVDFVRAYADRQWRRGI